MAVFFKICLGKKEREVEYVIEALGGPQSLKYLLCGSL